MEDHFTDASELFTPLKVTNTFTIHDDNDNEEAITKIPHGLTAKKERRKSYHHDFQGEFHLTPHRAPLTAPRANILNTLSISATDGSKRQLFKEILQQQHSPQAKKDLESSPGGLKRKSTDFEDDAETALSKLQKVEGRREVSDEEHFIEVSQTNTSDYEAGFEEKEELSRIELDNEPALGNSSPRLNEDILESIAADCSMQTPSRPTEPVALSPNTEQQSKVIDDSRFLLDTSKYPDIDDFLAESPLSRSNTTLDNELDLDLDAIDEFKLSPQKKDPTSPNKRPMFTITQVQEIQNDFNMQVERLEESLREKSSSVMTLNNSINEYKNLVYNLEDQVKSLELSKANAVKEQKLMKQEHGVYENDIKELKESVKAKNEKIHRANHLISKFKEKVSQLNTEIINRDNVINELQEDINSKSRAVNILNQRVSDFEDQAARLNGLMGERLSELEKVTQVNEELQSKVADLESSLEQRADEVNALKSQDSQLQGLYDEIQLQNERLLEENFTNMKLVSAASSERATLEEEIVNLKREIGDLKATQSSNAEELQSQLEIKIKELSLKDAMINGLERASITLKHDNESLRHEIASLNEIIKSYESQTVESKELLIVRKAEVDELNIEIASFKEQIADLTQTIYSKNREAETAKQSVSDREEEILLQSQKLQELESLLQKQESDHLIELEAYHAEMSNAQSIISTKSNELYQLKQENEKLVKDNDLLKYEMGTFKEDTVTFDQRINNLKAKLNESKSANDILETQVAQLTKERTTLENETDKRLQQLAEDLYIQYSKKHEQKVQVLKKGYENKWASKIGKFENENVKLKREIEGLNSQLEQERSEKAEIIKLWDNFKKGTDE